MKRIVTMFCAVAILAGLFSSCSKKVELTVDEAEKRDDVVVASLDGVSVSLSDYAYWYRMNQMSMEQQAIDSGDYTFDTLGDFWKSETDGVSNAQSLRDASLADAKHYANLLKLANDAQTIPDQADAEEKSALIDETLTALDSDPAKAAQAFLDIYGTTPNQMKRMYLGMGIVDQYFLELSTSEAWAPDDEIKTEFEANPELYDKVTVRHVLVLCGDGATQQEMDDAKAKAEDIFKQLSEGTDIGALAREYSEDPGSAENNGEYTFGRGEMVTEFEDWAFAAAEGDMGIVQTSYGFHVMLSMPKPGFEQVKDDIIMQLAYNKINEMMDNSYAKALEKWEENEEALGSINTDKHMVEAPAASAA